MKVFRWFVALTLVSFCALPAKEVVKIGVILPLTGNNADFGTPIQELLSYKFSHLPKDSKLDYKLVFEDDQLSPKNALLASHRLIDLEHVDAIVTMFTASGSVVAPYAAQKKVPHLMLNLNTAAADGQFNFITISPIDEAVKVWMDYVQKKGFHKVAFFIHRNAGGEMALKALQKEKGKSPLEWVACERYTPGEVDFRTELLKLRESKPDILFLFGYNPEQSIIMRQIKELGWDIPVSSTSNFEAAIKDPLFEGKWFVGSNTPTREFLAWYEKTFNKGYCAWTAPYSDIADLLYTSFEKGASTGKPSAETVAANLRSVKDFQGACGSISCNEKGVFLVPPKMLLIKNKSIVPIE